MMYMRYKYLTSEEERVRFRRAEPGGKLSQEGLDSLLTTDFAIVNTALGSQARLYAEAMAIWHHSLSEDLKKGLLRTEFYEWRGSEVVNVNVNVNATAYSHDA